MKLRNLLLSAVFVFNVAAAQNNEELSSLKYGDVRVIVTNDNGRNGFYEQKPIAALMGEIADKIGPDAILALGDVHHYGGVRSVQDPLWMTNYELIYSHPELMIEWFPICGNHEYRGNTGAVVDYSGVSRRWCMPAKYYVKRFENKGTTLKVVFLDTTPLIDKYRKKPDTYPDAALEDIDVQLDWLDKTLSDSSEDWVIVVGHHPVYADTDKSETERKDMQTRVEPILRKHNVAMYICGHIHNFQHIKRDDSPVDYIVNSSSSLSRSNVDKIDGSVFVSGSAGFSVLEATNENLVLSMIDSKGKIIHQVKKHK